MLQWISEIEFIEENIVWFENHYCMIKIIQAYFNFLYLSANMTKSSYLNSNKRRISIDHRIDQIKLRFVIESQIFEEFPFPLECLLMAFM